MTIHKEGKGTLTVSFIALFIINALVQYLIDLQWLQIATLALSVVLYAIVLQFFRNPKRTVTLNPDAIICPADGKVVTIEEVFEDEILKDKRIQVSIFMSPFNVHVNRYPLGGKVAEAIHHEGKFFSCLAPEKLDVERTHDGYY